MAERSGDYSQSIEVTPVGLLEVDRTVYNWFDVKHPTLINGRKVPVLFGSWERWAQIQGNKADENLNNLRDQNGMIKLPMISITRGDVTFDDNRYVRKDKNGFPDVTVVKKIATSKFDKSERVPFQEPYIKNTGGGTRNYKRAYPVYEVQSIPYPDFITINYTISFWSSYISHVNKFHEMVWQDAYPTDFEYQGHRFYASIDTQSDEGNVENFSDEERIIRHTFNMNVNAYLIPRSNVKISRSFTKIVLDESVIDLEALEETVDGEKLTFDEILARQRRPNEYSRNVQYPQEVVHAFSIDGDNIVITEDGEYVVAFDLGDAVFFDGR